jgi:YidC/Oxa1 family membrane protein insertase
MPVAGAYFLLTTLADITTPVLAIVLFTALVRLLVHPLTRAAVRGEKARMAIAPQARKLAERYKKDPAKLQEKTMALYQENGTSLFAGMLPMLVQAPVFMVMYRLFTTPRPLLDHTVLGTALGAHFTASPMFLGLLAALAVVAYGTFRWQAAFAERTGAPSTGLTRALRFLPFGTVLVGAIMPLAGGIYLLTTTSWTLLERAFLHRATGPQPRAGGPARTRTT